MQVLWGLAAHFGGMLRDQLLFGVAGVALSRLGQNQSQRLNGLVETSGNLIIVVQSLSFP